MKDGEPRQRLLQMTPLGELVAQFIATKIPSVLETSGLDAIHIISQCHDGASVMSGVCGSIQ